MESLITTVKWFLLVKILLSSSSFNHCLVIQIKSSIYCNVLPDGNHFNIEYNDAHGRPGCYNHSPYSYHPTQAHTYASPPSPTVVPPTCHPALPPQFHKLLLPYHQACDQHRPTPTPTPSNAPLCSTCTNQGEFWTFGKQIVTLVVWFSRVHLFLSCFAGKVWNKQLLHEYGIWVKLALWHLSLVSILNKMLITSPKKWRNISMVKKKYKWKSWKLSMIIWNKGPAIQLWQWCHTNLK